MTTHTLVANTALSGLSLSNGDTIALAGFALDIDTSSAVTGISVTTFGTAGTVTFSGTGVNADLSTWSFTAGTGVMIASVPSGVTIGEATGGTAGNAACIAINDGTVGTANGGGANAAFGVSLNNGTVTNAVGGYVTNAHGVSTNNGTVTNATGGTTTATYGLSTNNGTVVTATGGSGTTSYGISTNNGTVTNATGGTSTTSYGINTNNGTVTTAIGGEATTSYGINVNYGYVESAIGSDYANNVANGVNASWGKVGTATGSSVHVNNRGVRTNYGVVVLAVGMVGEGVDFNYGQVLGTIDSETKRAVTTFYGPIKIVDGPTFTGELVMRKFAIVETLYVLNGSLDSGAIIPESVTIVELSEGGGGISQAALSQAVYMASRGVRL